MSGIAGFYNAGTDFTEHTSYYEKLLHDMETALTPRGRDGRGYDLTAHAGLVHTKLAASDTHSSPGPFKTHMLGETFAIILDGEIYNAKELRHQLKEKGWTFETTSAAETLLISYLEYGPEFVSLLNGVFAFAVLDPLRQQLVLYRDRSGIKPLFYTVADETFFFASEPKGLLCCKGVEAVLDKKGLNEVFSLGPARTPGCGIYKGIHEVLPAHMMFLRPDGPHMHCYWKLKSHPHQDSYEKTVEKTAFLIQDAVRRQMASDDPVCTFLSGGVDSSVISAVCASELRKQGKQLATFSFDFVNNDRNFKANAFQPSLDRPYVDQMVSFLGSDHHYLECDNLAQADGLYDSVTAHDLPAMGDVDSSMLYFCSLVKDYNKVALTGECADEIFGGYPWFHKQECLEAPTFPWTMDLDARKVLLKDDFIQALGMDDYVKNAWQSSAAETPRLDGETAEDAKRREISYLNLRWFMQTLLNRMDRDSAFAGLEARVPFADHRIIEYLWNVPWEMKAKDGVVKSLLRQASLGLVPDEILFRRKSPYPKTYDTNYEKLLVHRVEEMMHDTNAPVMEFLDVKKLEVFLKSPSDYGKPWYGQLMAGPQMLAYMLQVNDWIKRYHVSVKI